MESSQLPTNDQKSAADASMKTSLAEEASERKEAASTNDESTVPQPRIIQRRKNPRTPTTSQSQQAAASRFALQPILIFYVFFTVNTLAALYAPIQDCDEVFNYWEPTHYLQHGFGLETWEYSPEYAIRSWLYIALHSIVSSFASLFSSQKTFQFYAVRTVLGGICAFTEMRLFVTIGKVLNPRVAIMFMLAVVTSPGFFHASAAFLPSSFSMYMVTMGLASFMDWKGGSNANVGIMWFGIGAFLGWPFVAALVLPLYAQEVLFAYITGEGVELLRRTLDGVTRSTIVMLLQLCVDAFFYHMPTVVSYNIVAYNIFGGSGRGPNIFGTEPWDFYFRNLLLNFNLWFILALLCGPILMLQILVPGKQSKFTAVRALFFASPFYMWLTIFSLQAHKEERFMYPAYPFLALNAAVALHAILGYVGTSNPKTLVGRIPARLKLVFVMIPVLLAIDVGVSRTVGLLTAYRAPLKVYTVLSEPGVTKPGDTVCLGKEWYRYPSSYFLPTGVRAKFIKSEFDGLLPGEFSEAKIGFGLFPGTWLVPAGMNDQNIADPSKYVDVAHCTFLVDSSFPSSNGTTLEPVYAQDTRTWEKLSCEPFLDNAATSLLGRALWLPNNPLVPEQHRRVWGEYCLLQRRSKAI
ncbi:mannosyltransferase [Agyrium rufum]|nr:mannosyltransferase [Agyrium rufum]